MMLFCQLALIAACGCAAMFAIIILPTYFGLFGYFVYVGFVFVLAVFAGKGVKLISLYFNDCEESEKETGKDAVVLSRTEDSASTNRSQWERSLAAYVRQQPGCSDVRENDRTLIVASDGHTPLEIDIYIPSLRLGIEANGIKCHDREAYRRDRRNGTEYSEEMYKERYCEHRGIKLIHVWDEDGDDEVHRQIDAAIREQRAKLY